MDRTVAFWAKRLFSLVAFGAVLKVLLGTKLIDFALVTSGWMLIGRILTIDDEIVGGFFNPDGDAPFQWIELLILGLGFVGLGLLKIWMSGG